MTVNALPVRRVRRRVSAIVVLAMGTASVGAVSTMRRSGAQGGEAAPAGTAAVAHGSTGPATRVNLATQPERPTVQGNVPNMEAEYMRRARQGNSTAAVGRVARPST